MKHITYVVKTNQSKYPLCLHDVINRILRNYTKRQQSNKIYLRLYVKIDKLILFVEEVNLKIMKMDSEYKFIEMLSYKNKNPEKDIFWLIKFLINDLPNRMQ